MHRTGLTPSYPTEAKLPALAMPSLTKPQCLSELHMALIWAANVYNIYK